MIAPIAEENLANTIIEQVLRANITNFEGLLFCAIKEHGSNRGTLAEVVKNIYRDMAHEDANEEGAPTDRLKSRICEPLKKKADDAIKGR